MWYAGIDWANDHHDALVIDEQGHQVGSIRIDHSPQGMSRLNTFLAQIIGSQSKEQMACIIETTHGLLIAHLLEAGWPVYPVNPRTVDRRRSASGAKTDTIDAYLLAKTGRADLAALHRLIPDSEKVSELQELTRDQDGLIRMQTRLVNQLTACLKAYYPIALELFTKLPQKCSLLFLQTYPTPQAAIAASVQPLEQVLRRARHPHPIRVAAQIFEQVHQPHLQADAVTTRSKARLMLVLVSQLLPLIEQIGKTDKEIATLFLTHEDHAIFASLPRAGQRLAPRRLPEIGDDRSRYQDESLLQALGGTSPVLFQSGMYSKAHRRMACIKPLRNALHQFAWQTTQSEPWAKQYYQRKRAEGKSHTVAVRALANVWVRIIFAMWVHHRCYEAITFETAQRQHARRAA
jgi:transposase